MAGRSRPLHGKNRGILRFAENDSGDEEAEKLRCRGPCPGATWRLDAAGRETLLPNLQKGHGFGEGLALPFLQQAMQAARPGELGGGAIRCERAGGRRPCIGTARPE